MEKEITFSKEVTKIIQKLVNYSGDNLNEFATPEHLLATLIKERGVENALNAVDGEVAHLKAQLDSYIDELDKMPADAVYIPGFSVQLEELISNAATIVANSGGEEIRIPHLMKALFDLEESMACFLLLDAIAGEEASFMSELVNQYDPLSMILDSVEGGDVKMDFMEDEHPSAQTDWRNLVVCLNDNVENRNPLVGREKELESTVMTLSRKDKNNVLHIGEPGVGKTALVYGLARLINEGDVPEGLRQSKIYGLDVGTLLAGTQFRGDFEKRLKMIMEGISREENPIVYIDEIHSLVGAGATGEGAMDASNMLKPYLEAGKIRFIGSTTYDEYKRYFAKNKGLVRRFRQIDITEPSTEEAIAILQRLKEHYEKFHGVVYTDESIRTAVVESARHISDRFLPDKAIDLIDEAGAWRKIHQGDNGSMEVDRHLITAVLAKICKVEALATREDDNERLATLRERLSSKVFGQEEAIREVTEAVQMSKAGLTEEGKPLASLLFVGPTGVGKTEVAKVLASELGIELLRFDMSEYTEKHTVAKLIGSPAGYVGYEDGGLLTDAVRKNPNVVLLLDEIEKAHPDIYNILLQVMDYARLTDNKGNRADFRNVILIMTSNAGAQYASQSMVGFGSSVTTGSAMMKAVKKTFKPEFLNRLSGTVVFNDMSREMASLILDKKLNQLRTMLKAKSVEMELSSEAHEWLLDKGFTKEYGAREIDRVLSSRLKPLLMREILFGKLKDGGKIYVSIDGDKLVLS